MVIHHVNDALHAPLVDGIHQMPQVILRTHVRVHRPVIPDGVGASHSALASGLTDGMDGHQPEDVRPQPPQSVQICLQRPEGALLRVAADKDAVDHLMPQ